MPRSGSTLLQNLLGQHPDIVATPTSPLYELVSACRDVHATSQTVKAYGVHQHLPHALSYIREGINAYCRDNNAKIVVDKSRGWLGARKFLRSIYGDDFTIIVNVRDLRAIFADMEKSHRENVHYRDQIMVTAMPYTQIGRIRGWGNNVPLAPFIHSLYDALEMGDTANLVFVKFEDIIADPQSELNRLVSCIGLPPHTFNTDYIAQLTSEDDVHHGSIYGKHTINSKLELQDVDNFSDFLRPDSIAMIEQEYDFYFKYFKYGAYKRR
jgi:hypothetical protein